MMFDALPVDCARSSLYLQLLGLETLTGCRRAHALDTVTVALTTPLAATVLADAVSTAQVRGTAVAVGLALGRAALAIRQLVGLMRRGWLHDAGLVVATLHHASRPARTRATDLLAAGRAAGERAPVTHRGRIAEALIPAAAIVV